MMGEPVMSTTNPEAERESDTANQDMALSHSLLFYYRFASRHETCVKYENGKVKSPR